METRTPACPGSRSTPSSSVFFSDLNFFYKVGCFLETGWCVEFFFLCSILLYVACFFEAQWPLRSGSFAAIPEPSQWTKKARASNSISKKYVIEPRSSARRSLEYLSGDHWQYLPSTQSKLVQLPQLQVFMKNRGWTVGFNVTQKPFGYRSSIT